jgi:hypothetical protein
MKTVKQSGNILGAVTMPDMRRLITIIPLVWGNHQAWTGEGGFIVIGGEQLKD